MRSDFSCHLACWFGPHWSSVYASRCWTAGPARRHSMVGWPRPTINRPITPGRRMNCLSVTMATRATRHANMATVDTWPNGGRPRPVCSGPGRTCCQRGSPEERRPGAGGPAAARQPASRRPPNARYGVRFQTVCDCSVYVCGLGFFSMG